MTHFQSLYATIFLTEKAVITLSDTIIVALLSLVGTMAGAYFANRKSSALIAYRLEQLEDKVNKHNQVVERTYQLEEQEALLEEKVKVANHRIEDLEGFHKPH